MKFDKYFPILFDTFWTWQQSRLWSQNILIFDANFHVWLKHLVPSKSDKLSLAKNYVPRSETDEWNGPFSQCVSRLKITKWVSSCSRKHARQIKCVCLKL